MVATPKSTIWGSNLNMNSKYLGITLVTLALVAGLGDTAWAEEKRSAIFSITPAVSFAWYPYAYYSRQESTKTETDINNIGISALMSLKLFDKVGAQLGLKIDDPTFQKMVDFAGYINIYGVMLNFDYHFFGETITWEGSTPNPIPGGSYHFRSHWTNISLLYNFLPLVAKDYPQIGAVGITYSSFEMPLEYRVKKGSGLYPGFGLVKGNAWGLSLLADTLVGSMELSPEAGNRSLYSFPLFGSNVDLWFYVDAFYGLFLQKGEIDAEALARMVNANGGASIDGDITRNFSMFYSDDDDNDKNDPPLSIMKLSAIMGLQKVWDIGKKARIGFAIGAEIRIENFFTSSNDIKVGFDSMNVGPVIRLSARW